MPALPRRLRLLYNKCCLIATIPGRSQALSISPHRRSLTIGPKDLDVEVADFLTQRVAVDPQQVGGADLIAARSGQRHRQERMLNFAQHPVVEPGRRQAVAKAREIGGEVAL